MAHSQALPIDERLIETFPTEVRSVRRKFKSVDQRGHLTKAVDTSGWWKFGGAHNNIGPVGMVVLDRMVSGECPTKTVPFSSAGQDFYKLRAECLKTKKMFEDPQFPASDKSVSRAEHEEVWWLRPQEIAPNPILFDETHKGFQQGPLANCWFMAGAICLTLNDGLFYHVVPPDQSFGENYCGIFHFRFWRYGEWVDVVIDDRLPVDSNRTLVYARSISPNEFWISLLEKAYAKVYGSYEAITLGQPDMSLVDFTGGICETFVNLPAVQPSLAPLIEKVYEYGGLMACSVNPDPQHGVVLLPNGLVTAHSYAITKVKKVRGTSIVRIRNPLGGEAAWTGAWSRDSQEWIDLLPSEQDEIGNRFATDSEFWMSYDEFVANFSRLDVCYLDIKALESIFELTGINISGSKSWHSYQVSGEWKKGFTAGGHIADPASMATNPQYLIRIRYPESPSWEHGHAWEDDYTFVASIMQKNRHEKNYLRDPAYPMLYIGFYLYKLNPSDNKKKKTADFFARERNESIEFKRGRENVRRFRLEPADYIFVPTTWAKDEEESFLIRFFTTAQMSITKLE